MTKEEIDKLLEGVEMPEPVGYQWMRTGHYRKNLPADAEKYCWEPLHTADQLRSTVAAAVLREQRKHCACVFKNGKNTEKCKLHGAWCDTLHEQGTYRRERDALQAENEKLRQACNKFSEAEMLMKGQP